MTQQILNGILLNEQSELTLQDLCRACSSSAEWIIELVDEGVLDPVDMESVSYQQTQWRFSCDSLQRARTAKHLQRDLGVNLAGIALALDLLEEIKTLETHVRRYDINIES